jgi:hypothetical protein
MTNKDSNKKQLYDEPISMLSLTTTKSKTIKMLVMMKTKQIYEDITKVSDRKGMDLFLMNE